MEQAITQLIDAASKAAGNDTKLAIKIGANQQHISQWRNGTRTCPPADVALMAYVAGLDAVEWGLKAMASKYSGTAKGELLMQVLKIGSTSAEPARTALEVIATQLDDAPEAKAGIMAVLDAFPPESEKLKSKQNTTGASTKPAASRFFFVHAFHPRLGRRLPSSLRSVEQLRRVSIRQRA